MRLTKRWLGVFLMAVAVASPVVVAGCAEHARVRVYDPTTATTMRGTTMKSSSIASGLWRLTGLTVNFARCRPKSSESMGTGATIIRITTESCPHILWFGKK